MRVSILGRRHREEEDQEGAPVGIGVLGHSKYGRGKQEKKTIEDWRGKRGLGMVCKLKEEKGRKWKEEKELKCFSYMRRKEKKTNERICGALSEQRC